MQPEDLKKLQQDIRDIKLDIAYIKQMLLALAKGPPRTETRWGETEGELSETQRCLIRLVGI